MKSLQGRLASLLGSAAAVVDTKDVRVVDPNTITSSCGKKGTPLRRIIGYRHEGPYHRQVGLKWMLNEAWPIVQTYYKHHFLHATKGWRVYTGGPAMRIPQPIHRGFQLLKRSTWRPNRKERRLGHIPRPYVAA